MVDPAVVSDGNTITSTAEGSYGVGSFGSNVESFPVGYDFRSDNFTTGTYSFVYSDLDPVGNGLQGVFLLSDPTPISSVIHTTDASLFGTSDLIHTTDASLIIQSSINHSTNALVALFRTLGHTTNTLLRSSKSLSNTTNALLEDFTIRGSGSFLVGANFDANGIIGGTFVSIVDPSCLNRRILSKYGWESTTTPTKTYSKCDPKR